MNAHAILKSFRSLLLPLLLSPVQLSAESISLNFIRGSSGESPLSPTDVAGQIPAANWNNSTTANANAEATGIVLTDDSGTDTTAVATWQSGSGSWSVPLAGTGTPADILMMAGYLDQGADGAGQVHTVTIKDIPYADYDVYLYHASNGGPNRTAKYQANGEEIFTRNLADAGVFDGFVRAGYGSLAEAANLENEAGNYVRWENLSGATQTILAEGLGVAEGGAGDNTRRAPIQGIQIVEIAPGLPKVINAAPESVTFENAIAKGELLKSGTGADEATTTFYYGEADGGNDPTAWANNVPAGSLTAPGSFQATLTGLDSSTTYYYRASATNSVGDFIAPTTLTFTTLPDPVFPEVENRPATDLAITGATLNAELLNNGAGADSSVVTFYWGTVDGGTDANLWENTVVAGTLTAPGLVSSDLTGLTGNVRYFYRSLSRNSAGDDWAPQTSDFLTLPPPVQALSLNFVRGSSGETALDPTDLAGFIPATNWNNSTTDNANGATAFAMIDNLGVATTALATWQSGSASWSVATTGAGSAADKKLMSGYLDQGADGSGQIHTISVTGIPYPVYNVYLYHSSSGGPNRTARFQANGTDIFTRNLDPADTFNAFTNAQYETLDEAVLLENPAGNVVLWENLSGDLTIEGEGIGDAEGGSGGNTRRAPIQGIQIVAASATRPLQITQVTYNAGAGKVDLTFNAIVGLSYAIESSTDLDTPDEEWLELVDSITPDADTFTYSHTLPNPAPAKLFYRVRIQ